MANVFISYSRDDKDYAEALANMLHKRGATVWWDTELMPAERFRDRILEEIENADVIVVLWSKSSRSSMWVSDEAKVALDSEKLIQVSLDGEPQPTGYGQATINQLDLSNWNINDPTSLSTSLFEAIETFIPKRESVEILRQRLTVEIDHSRAEISKLKTLSNLLSIGLVGTLLLAGFTLYQSYSQKESVVKSFDERIELGIQNSIKEDGLIWSEFTPVYKSHDQRISSIEESTLLTEPLKPLLIGVKNNVINGAEFPIKIEKDGLLIVSLNVENNEGRGRGDERTIYSRSQIVLDQEICSDDYSAYYIWNGIAMANSVCMKHLKAGDHSLIFNSTSSNESSTKNRISYVVIPMDK